MGRMYSATFEEVAVTAVQDLFGLLAPADMSVVIHGLVISQSSDAGDSESEQLSILIHRATLGGSGGSLLTPAPMHVGDVASTVTARANDDVLGTEGTQIHAECFNVMAGLQIWWTPETRPIISPSGRLTAKLQTAPVDSITMSGTIYFEEIGG